LAACLLAVGAAGGAPEPLELGKAHVEEVLVGELASLVGGGLAKLQESLRPTFAALPKNVHGNLGQNEVRLALRRTFAPRGWLIKGLEANGPEAWIAPYAQQLLEDRRGDRGLGLAEVSALAATLERLVAKEASGRLAAAYEALGLSSDRTAAREEMEAAVRLYAAGHLATNLSTAPAWPQVEERLRRLEVPEGGLGFDTVLRVVQEIAEKYARLSERSCRDAKTALLGAEASRAGRVSLQDFQAQPAFMHWRFDEGIEELRAFGALDETDPTAPQVVVADYLAARPSCLGGSSIHAACCRSECEELMARLETAVAAPGAEPKRIAEAAAGLGPSAPHATLSQRLEVLATANGGLVPLHGEAFADWMHHAFPRVCPRARAGAVSSLPWAEAEELLAVTPAAAPQQASALALIGALVFVCAGWLLASYAFAPPTEQHAEEQPSAEKPTEDQPTQKPTEEPADSQPAEKPTQEPAEGQPAEKPLEETPRGQSVEKLLVKPTRDHSGEPTGAFVGLLILCILALVTNLLDATVVAGALAAGLAMLAVPRLMPKRAPLKCKEC